MASSEPNLGEISEFLIGLAKQAGAMITSARPTTGAELGLKKNSADLVTETDKAVEVAISTALKERYPEYAFVGEESYTASTVVTEAPTFIVDPIDGTTNFVHSFPHVCVSLGFAHKRRAAVGVVYNPFLGLMYHAVRGQGAFLTQPLPAAAAAAAAVPAAATEVTRRLPLRPPHDPLRLDAALVAIEWGSERVGNNWKVKSQTFASLAAAQDEPVHGAQGGGMVHGLRSLGSAALNMCSVAAGELDAYWEGGCWSWDVCAGWVILEEAGGHVVGGNPGEWDIGLSDRRYLCVRGAKDENEWKPFVEDFWSHVKGRFEY